MKSSRSTYPSHQYHGGRLWTWTLAAPWDASFHIEPSRSQSAAKEVLGTSPTGVPQPARAVAGAMALHHRSGEIAPINNLAERAVRGVVIYRKISYVTRSGRGMRFVERAYGAAHTCRQQGRSLFDFLYDSLDSHFLGTTPRPSLVPTG